MLEKKVEELRVVREKALHESVESYQGSCILVVPEDNNEYEWKWRNCSTSELFIEDEEIGKQATVRFGIRVVVESVE